MSCSHVTQNNQRNAKVQRKSLFQGAISLAIREYMIFALPHFHPALLHELYARVSWASWEETVQIFGDDLRRRLDHLYAEPCSPGAFLVNVPAYQAMAHAARAKPINNHYMSERAPFIRELRKALLKTLADTQLSSEPVDHVMPTETPILLRHALRAWRYPHTAPSLKFTDIAPRGANRLGGDANDSDQQRSYNTTEYIVSAQRAFLIEPVFVEHVPEVLYGQHLSADDVDGETDMGSQLALLRQQYIRAEFVDRARFPLSVFHASKESLQRFDVARSAYHMTMQQTAIAAYANWLAKHSNYQFQLMLAFVEAVDRYLSIYTFALPRHIADAQISTLRVLYCVPQDKPIPKHLMRSMICTNCQRCTTVLPATEERFTAQAIGNEGVRYELVSDDDIVFENVRKRALGGAPAILPLQSLTKAESLTRVWQHRSYLSTPVYDKYCGEFSSEARRDNLLLGESGIGHEWRAVAARMTNNDRKAQPVFVWPPPQAAVRNDMQLSCVDRRTILADVESGANNNNNGRVDKKLQLVARGKGRLGELDFDKDLWREVDRRMRVYDPDLCDSNDSFLLYGHTFNDNDNDNGTARYSRLRWLDAKQHAKQEGKAAKALYEMLKKIKELDQQIEDIEYSLRVDERQVNIAVDNYNHSSTMGTEGADGKLAVAIVDSGVANGRKQIEKKEKHLRDVRTQRRNLKQKYDERVRLGALTGARNSSCAREEMLEVEFCGRGLRATDVFHPDKIPMLGKDDWLMACCDCLTRMFSAQAMPIADRVVCAQCYGESVRSGGTVAQRTVRGESIKAVSSRGVTQSINLLDSIVSNVNRKTKKKKSTVTAGAGPMDEDQKVCDDDDDDDDDASEQNAVRELEPLVLQKLLSPSYMVICSQLVPLGTPCVMAQCKEYKTRYTHMYGLEALNDQQAGNETYVTVYMCHKHARAHSLVFKLPYTVSMSALEEYLVHNRKDFNISAQTGRFIDDFLRRTASQGAANSTRKYMSAKKRAAKSSEELRAKKQGAAEKKAKTMQRTQAMAELLADEN